MKWEGVLIHLIEVTLSSWKIFFNSTPSDASSWHNVFPVSIFVQKNRKCYEKFLITDQKMFRCKMESWGRERQIEYLLHVCMCIKTVGVDLNIVSLLSNPIIFRWIRQNNFTNKNWKNNLTSGGDYSFFWFRISRRAKLIV